jgi:hypothetical protein
MDEQEAGFPVTFEIPTVTQNSAMAICHFSFYIMYVIRNQMTDLYRDYAFRFFTISPKMLEFLTTYSEASEGSF